MDTQQLEKKKELIAYYREIKNFEKRKQICLEVLQETPKDEYVLQSLAGTYSELQQQDDCIRTCFETLENSTDLRIKAWTLNLLGSEYSFIFEYEKAEKYLKEAIAIEPNNAIYLSSYAITLAFLGKKTESDEFFSLAESLDPTNYYMLIDKYNLYDKLYNDMETEREILSKILELSSDPLRMNIYLGNFNFKYKNYEEAHEFYLKALLINPNITKDLKDMFEYCKSLAEHSNFEKDVFGELEEKQREELSGYMDRQEYELAGKYCANILTESSWSNICALYYTAAIEFKLKKYNSCIFTCHKLVGTKQENYIFYILGQSYLNLRSYKKALTFLGKALEFLPRDLDIQAHFAICLAELGRLDEAIDFIQKSIHCKEQKMLHCKFLILYVCGDCMEDELKTLNDFKILSMRNENMLNWVYFFYALTYEKYGQSANALEYMDKVKNRFLCRDIEIAYERIKKMNGTGVKSLTIGILRVFNRKRSKRLTYHVPSWEIIKTSNFFR